MVEKYNFDNYTRHITFGSIGVILCKCMNSSLLEKIFLRISPNIVMTTILQLLIGQWFPTGGSAKHFRGVNQVDINQVSKHFGFEVVRQQISEESFKI